MSNETKLKKDIVFKDYFGNPVIFTDFLNGSLYDGNHHYHEQFFETDDTDMSLVDIDKLETYERRRDVAFRYKNNQGVSFICLENQSDVDEVMPVRILVYDAFRYNKQLQRGNDIHYVKTVTFYCGDRGWKHPLNLRGVLRSHQDINNENNDWEMILIDLKKLNKDYYKVESNYLLVKYGKMILKYGKDPKLFKGISLPRQLFILLALLLGTDEIFHYAKEIKKEEINMCESLEYLLSTERAEGRIEGKRETLIVNIKSLMKNANYSIKQAMDTLEIPINERDEIKALL